MRLPTLNFSWKGPTSSSTSVVPTYSKPVQTLSGVDNGLAFKARPIRHYRKQLLPTPGSAYSRAGIGMPMDLPGGATALGVVPPAGGAIVGCQVDNVSPRDPVCDLTDVTPCPAPRPFIRRATTLLKKNYYTDSRAYLRSRCQLYDQKLSANPVPGIAYINSQTGLPLYPTDSPTGPQVRYTQNCANNCQGTGSAQGPITEMATALTIYKPSNRPFAHQGAVDASLQNVRLVVNDLKTKNPPVPLREKNWPLLHYPRGTDGIN